MKDSIPDHLKPVRQILMDSANGPEDDEAPPASTDLLDDLEKSLGGAEPLAPASPAPGFFEKVRSLFATPAFGLVAALIVVLFVALPLFNGGHGFRGGNDPQQTVAIVLSGIDDATFEQLTSSGTLDPDALTRSEAPDSLPGPKLVLDFDAGTMTGTGSDGSEAFQEALPANPEELPAAIAQALTRFES